MGLARPTGGHAEQMLDPGGWPEVDEDAFYDRGLAYTEVLRQVTEVLETCRHQQTEIFDGGIWSGAAAGAANSELGAIVSELMTLQNGLATVITWHRYIGASIAQAKSSICDNVEVADTQIKAIENDSSLDAGERIAAVNLVIGTTHGANSAVIGTIADQILASKAWKPPGNTLKDLLDQKTPPPVTIPDAALPMPAPPVPAPAVPAQPGEQLPGPAQPAPVIPAPVSPVRPPSPGVPAPGVTPLPPTLNPPPTGQPPQSPVPTPVRPNPAVPGTPGVSPSAPTTEAPGGPAVPVSPVGPPSPAAPKSPAAPTQPPGASEQGKGIVPASASGTPQSGTSKITDETSAAAAPAAATGPPAAPPIPAASGGAAAGRGTGSAAPVGQKPPGAQPSMRPAAAKPAAARPGAERPTSSEHPEPPDAATVPPIPVSAARAVRDAVADASTADAARRQGDPLRLARHIAAALNAPGSGGEGDFGFFWVTALTSDGAIVVANSYGMAYIPEGVRLPERVHMASADDAIPVPERARWATYPIMAVQGWAARRDLKLRMIIGTEEQLANSDPGAAKVVLQPDDIPETGDMAGRPRLVVVDPVAAERLGATPDARLTGLLPPAPVDADPPADRRPELWFDVMKPMMSRASGREVAHLRAFHTYAAHVTEILFAQAHIAAADPVSQRSAIADWLYWKRLAELLDTAFVDAT